MIPALPAHNTLQSTSPAGGAAVTALPARVSFTFGQPVQDAPDYNAIVVAGPGGTHWATSGLKVYGNTISTAVGPLGPAGAYTLTYRIVGADGHPSSGRITVTLTRPGTGHPVAAAPPPEPTGSGLTSLPTWWLLAALALVVLVAAVRRRPA